MQDETYYAALRRLKANIGEEFPNHIFDYQEAHPGVSLRDAVLALAGEPTYEELRRERDALRARLAAIRAALAPALAVEGANAPPWGNGGPYSFDIRGVDDRYIGAIGADADTALVIALRNALPALAAALGSTAPPEAPAAPPVFSWVVSPDAARAQAGRMLNHDEEA